MTYCPDNANESATGRRFRIEISPAALEALPSLPELVGPGLAQGLQEAAEELLAFAGSPGIEPERILTLLSLAISQAHSALQQEASLDGDR